MKTININKLDLSFFLQQLKTAVNLFLLLRVVEKKKKKNYTAANLFSNFNNILPAKITLIKSTILISCTNHKDHQTFKRQLILNVYDASKI